MFYVISPFKRENAYNYEVFIVYNSLKFIVSCAYLNMYKALLGMLKHMFIQISNTETMFHILVFAQQIVCPKRYYFVF